jgi:hypothetical protein
MASRHRILYDRTRHTGTAEGAPSPRRTVWRCGAAASPSHGTSRCKYDRPVAAPRDCRLAQRPPPAEHAPAVASLRPVSDPGWDILKTLVSVELHDIDIVAVVAGPGPVTAQQAATLNGPPVQVRPYVSEPGVPQITVNPGTPNPFPSDTRPRDCPEIGGITPRAIRSAGHVANGGSRMRWVLGLVGTRIDGQTVGEGGAYFGDFRGGHCFQLVRDPDPSRAGFLGVWDHRIPFRNRRTCRVWVGCRPRGLEIDGHGHVFLPASRGSFVECDSLDVTKVEPLDRLADVKLQHASQPLVGDPDETGGGGASQASVDVRATPIARAARVNQARNSSFPE